MDTIQLIGDMDTMTTPEPPETAARRGHLVIVPIPFRNELLGAGLMLGAGYLYQPKDAVSSSRHSVAGVGGMYAEGGSWAAIAGHRGYWARERYRTTIGAGTGEVFYDLELDLEGQTRAISLAQTFDMATVQAGIRVGSHGWLGAGFLYGETAVDVRRADITPPDEIEPDTTITLSNLRLNGEWDTRDSDIYPRAGHRAQADGAIAREKWGSDSDYETLDLEYNGYRSFGKRNVLAWRVAGKIVGGDAPFFAMAWFGSGCDLRGYAPGRYIGKSMVAAQAEWRWQATPRWGFVAFGGAGTVSGALGDVDTDRWLPAAGTGVRFRLLKSMDLNMRADFAWGRDDSTFALSVGEAF